MKTDAGVVYLVGAGPGDPELLTLKGKRLIEEADVLLHDDLVSREVLSIARADALTINVGKRCGQKTITQAQIHVLVMLFASRGLRVVRLKSGDPSLFGRSSEEITALQNAGLQVEVVPGVTAALAAVASAKVSLTQRDVASTVVFTTAHLCTGGSDAEHWKNIAGPRRTLAIYMPGRNLGALATELIRAGFEADTPCLVVSSASTALEQQLQSTLGEIGSHADLPMPSIFFVGDALADPEERRLEMEYAGVARFEEAAITESWSRDEGGR